MKRGNIIIICCRGMLTLLIVSLLALMTSCGDKKLEQRYSSLFSPGEGLSYRSFVFEVDQPTTEPFPVQINDLYAYSVNRQAAHVEQVTEPVFQAAKLFTEELGAVKADGKWGFIRILSEDDRSFEYVIPLTYEGAEPFSEGLAAVKQGGLYGYIDKTGTMVIQPAFIQAHYFSDGLAAVSDEHGWYFIDMSGQVIIPGPFEDAESFYGEQAPVKKEGKWGFIDLSGQFVIDAIYDDAWSFESSKHAAVKKNDKWIIIDWYGDRVLFPGLK